MLPNSQSFIEYRSLFISSALRERTKPFLCRWLPIRQVSPFPSFFAISVTFISDRGQPASFINVANGVTFSSSQMSEFRHHYFFGRIPRELASTISRYCSATSGAPILHVDVVAATTRLPHRRILPPSPLIVSPPDRHHRYHRFRPLSGQQADE